jgi:hypothetical protein
MATSSLFRQATKTQSRARVALIGPSGSGKTYTALSIASGLGERVCVLDTERGSAAKYSDQFSFMVAADMPDFSPDTYTRYIKAAEAEGFDVIVIDSLSHAWAGKGGALEMVDNEKARGGGNQFTAWKNVTPAHNGMVDAILQCHAHVIVTMRSKSEFVVEKDDSGKMVPRKIGLAPIQRDGLEYEFDVVADMDLAHTLVVSKTRCKALDGAVIRKPDGALADTLKAWLTDGAPIPEPEAPAFTPAQVPETLPVPSPPFRDEITQRILNLQHRLADEHDLKMADLVAATAVLRDEITGKRAKKLADLTEAEADQVAEGLVQWAAKQPQPAPDEAPDVDTHPEEARD